MKSIKVLGVLLAAVAAMPIASFAQQLASASSYVNLRAGPSRDYPIIAMLPAGIDISVIGCLDDYRWCDVVAGRDRGWVYAGNIIYPYQDAYVPLLTYGPVIGIGIIAFDQGRYWHRHYRAHPWYRQRHDWIDRQRHDGHHAAQPIPPIGFQTQPRHEHPRWPAAAPPPLRGQGPGLPQHPHQQGQVRPPQEQARGFNMAPHTVQNMNRGANPHGNALPHPQKK